MNSEKIKLKQEKNNLRATANRLSFSQQIRDRLIDKIVGQLAVVDEDTLISERENIQANIYRDIMVAGVRLGYYDEKLTTDRLIETFKQVTMDTRSMVKSTMRDIDPYKLDEILNRTIDNKTYSDRIWINKAKLVTELETIVQRQIKHGTDLKKLARDISYRYEVDFNSAYRLLHNESARVEFEAKEIVYAESELVEEVERITMEDDLVSEICRSEHGDIWRKDDPNKPTLPRHVNCRCMYRPVYKNMDKYKF